MPLPQLFLSSSTASVLIVALLKATVVLALAQWIVAAAPSLSAASRHLLLSFALSAFLVIPIVSLALPRVVVAVPAPAIAVVDVAPSQSSSTAHPVETTAAAAASSPAQRPAAHRAIPMSAGAMLLIVWAAGVLLLFWRLGLAAARLRLIVRTASGAPRHIGELLEATRRQIGLDVPVRALVTDRVAVPMIWGVRSGTLLLPVVASEWEEELLHATIVHELGHLQRLDYVALAVMNAVASLFWFHPQVWTARRRALTEGEHACDDLVLRSGARASEYASHLLSVARLMPRREPLAAILAMSRPTQLEGRMYAILSPTINRQAVGGKLLMASAISFMLLVAPLATLQLSAQAPAPAPAMPIVASSMVASTIAQADTSPRHADHAARRHSSDALTSTGTCADFRHGFDTDAVVRAQENLTYAGTALAIESENGAINVLHAAGSTFGITVCKSAGGLNDAAAQQRLSQISVQERNGKVSMSGPDGGEWSVDLIVTVPDNRSINVKGDNGPVSFSGVNATIDASVQNGPLAFRDSRGEIKGTAINGPVSISGGSGNVVLGTQNGPLSLDLDGQAWVGGELRAHVENGPIRVSVPPGYQTGIALQAGRGAPLHCDADICGDLSDRGRRMDAEVKTTIGTGPARIFVEGGHGPVSVKQKSSMQ